MISGIYSPYNLARRTEHTTSRKGKLNETHQDWIRYNTWPLWSAPDDGIPCNFTLGYLCAAQKIKKNKSIMTIIETIETSTFASARLKRPFQWNVINGQRSVSPEPLPKKARSESPDFCREQVTLSSSAIPAQQKVLLLLGKGQRYELEENYAVPEIRDDRELLLKIQYIGLNPIDWKSV